MKRFSKVKLPSPLSESQSDHQSTRRTLLTESSIVFIHRLRGHRTKTWTSKDDLCWPKELLSKEEVLSHIRVISFGYDANINLKGWVSLDSLFGHSISLLNELSRARMQDVVSLLSFSQARLKFKYIY
jgi:hypothetical protein